MNNLKQHLSFLSTVHNTVTNLFVPRSTDTPSSSPANPIVDNNNSYVPPMAMESTTECCDYCGAFDEEGETPTTTMMTTPKKKQLSLSWKTRSRHCDIITPLREATTTLRLSSGEVIDLHGTKLTYRKHHMTLSTRPTDTDDEQQQQQHHHKHSSHVTHVAQLLPKLRPKNAAEQFGVSSSASACRKHGRGNGGIFTNVRGSDAVIVRDVERRVCLTMVRRKLKMSEDGVVDVIAEIRGDEENEVMLCKVAHIIREGTRLVMRDSHKSFVIADVHPVANTRVNKDRRRRPGKKNKVDEGVRSSSSFRVDVRQWDERGLLSVQVIAMMAVVIGVMEW